MLSPTPLSLFCALLLCLPLAVIFTVTTTPDPTTVTPSTNDDPVAISAAAAAAAINTTQNEEKGTAKNESFSLPLIYSNTTAPIPPLSEIKNATRLFPPPPPPPPPVIYDDEEDNSLFRVAAGVNPEPEDRKKVAFLFLVTSSLPLAELWEAYFNKTRKNLYNIYIHAGDPNARFEGVFSNRVVSSKTALRHTPTLVSAARRLLSHALLHDPSNYMFALLSPSCIPLHSFNFTYHTLTRSDKSFIEILRNEPWAYGRWTARGPDAMLPEVRLQDFRIGSQFWALTRRHARMVVEDTKLWSKFRLACVRRDTCYPEENYFPTLLSMLDPGGCVPATLTHVDWKGRHDGHPRTYVADQVVPELIQRLRSDPPRYGDDGGNGSDWLDNQRTDPFLFARKFAPNTLRTLMSIANDVIFRD